MIHWLLSKMFAPLEQKEVDVGLEEAPTAGQAISSALMLQNELMGPIIDSCIGFRRDLEARGFNETVSEALAAQYMSLMLLNMFSVKIPDV